MMWGRAAAGAGGLPASGRVRVRLTRVLGTWAGLKAPY
jgi:hypothetical protein